MKDSDIGTDLQILSKDSDIFDRDPDIDIFDRDPDIGNDIAKLFEEKED